MQARILRIALLLAAGLLSSCAPTLMSAESFPIKPGDTWTLDFEQSPKVERDFILRGKPHRESDYVAYGGSADDSDVVALLTDDEILMVLIMLDDNPEDQQKILHCIMENDGGSWSGHGFVGTHKEFMGLSRTKLFKQPLCQVEPKRLSQTQS